jgi:hypothetical protein
MIRLLCVRIGNGIENRIPFPEYYEDNTIFAAENQKEFVKAVAEDCYFLLYLVSEKFVL